MNFDRSSLPSAALITALLMPALACEKKPTTPPAEEQDDAIDRDTKDLVWNLRVGEREELAASFPTLASQIDDRDLAVLSRTLTWLGQQSSFVRVGEQPLVDGVERRYTLSFEKGEIELTVSVIAGKLTGFTFEEDRWTSYVDQSAAAAAGSMRVTAFYYVDRKGKATTVLDPKAINYELVLEGLGAALREHHVSISKSVFDEGGKQVYRQREPDEMRFSQSDTGASGGKISGTVGVPGPGKYELQLEIRDLTQEQTLTHRVKFTIE